MLRAACFIDIRVWLYSELVFTALATTISKGVTHDVLYFNAWWILVGLDLDNLNALIRAKRKRENGEKTLALDVGGKPQRIIPWKTYAVQ